MTNKRLTIENLDILEELNTEAVLSVEGGMTLADPESERIQSESRLISWPTRPFPDGPTRPFPDKPVKPFPDRPIKPYPLPYYPCSPSPYGKLPWCAVIL